MHPLRRNSETRLRAPWRIAWILLVSYTLLIIGVIATRETLPLVGLPAEAPYTIFANGVVSVVVIGLVVVVATKIDRRDGVDYGLHLDTGWVHDLIGGGVSGVIVATLAVALGVFLGYARVVEVVSPGHNGSVPVLIGLTFIGMAGIVLFEEILFRGIIITNLLDGLASFDLSETYEFIGAILISALLFGPPHLLGGVTMEGESLLIAMGGFLAMGVVFAVAFILTRELAFPIGLHFGYNVSNAVMYAPTEAFAKPYATVFRLDFALAGYFNSITYDLVVGFSSLLLIATWMYVSRGQLSPTE